MSRRQGWGGRAGEGLAEPRRVDGRSDTTGLSHGTRHPAPRSSARGAPRRVVLRCSRRGALCTPHVSAIRKNGAAAGGRLGEGPRVPCGVCWGDGPLTTFPALPRARACGGPLTLGSWHRKAHCSPPKRV